MKGDPPPPMEKEFVRLEPIIVTAVMKSLINPSLRISNTSQKQMHRFSITREPPHLIDHHDDSCPIIEGTLDHP
jgi:hypothetical protein